MSATRSYILIQGTNGYYISDDLGLTWTLVSSTSINTSVADDIGPSPFNLNKILIINDNDIYLSENAGAAFDPPSTIAGREIIYASPDVVVTGGIKRDDATGSHISISYNAGATFSDTVDLSNLFDYPGANYTNITVMGIHFPNPGIGYAAVTGNEQDPTADQLVARSTTGGLTWSDAIVIPGSEGTIRAVTCDFENDSVIYAIGPEDQPTGKLYKINRTLSDAPVEVLTGITVGNVGDTNVTKFSSVPNLPNQIYFLDSAGDLYYSDDSGSTWTLKTNVGLDKVDISVIDANIILILGAGAVARSEDSGATFTDITNSNWGKPAAVDYNNSFLCNECPPGYTRNSTTKLCELYTLGGPLCNPPYFLYGPNGQCALPSTIQPSNIVYAIDNSGSVDANELVYFKEFINILTGKLEERLLLGSIKVAVVHWSTTACLGLDFTSDKAAIDASVDEITSCPDCLGADCGGSTNHIAAFCTSINALYTESNSRSNAENILIVFTDGSNNVADSCDLTALGLSPTATDFGADFLNLAKDAKANLAGKGVKIMTCVVGNRVDREDVRKQFVDTPIADGLDPYPSLDENGDPYYFDAGDFNQAQFVAEQLILGLGAQFSPSLDCPPDCTKVPGPDNLGYCECLSATPYLPCQYKLEDCQDLAIPIITDSDLEYYYTNDKIITINGSDVCWNIIKLDEADFIPDPTTVLVAKNYAQCSECMTSYKLVNCKDPNNVLYTVVDFSAVVDKIVKVQEYPDECWTVVLNTDTTYTPVTLTVSGTPYETCISCNPTKYQLTNCLNDMAFIISDTDLSAYMNKVIRAVGFPGICFSITEPQCKCINVTVNGVSYTVMADAVKFNGKNKYTFQTNDLTDMVIAWNSNPDRWEVFDPNNLTVYAYNTVSTDCPFSSSWTTESTSSYTVSSVAYCYSEVYSITVDQEFPNCQYCINC